MAVDRTHGTETGLMKSISTAMAAHITQEVTTLCSCWKIVRTDGVVFGFTDHDVSFNYNSLLYESQVGFDRTAISADSSYAVDNMDVAGFFDAEAITEEDLRNGLYNFAEVYVFLVNWADLTMGDIKVRRGWFGEITINKAGQFHIELRGMNQALSHTFVEVFTPECRADFCDARCKLQLLDYAQVATVTAISSNSQFTIAPLTIPTVPASGYTVGTVNWKSGLNNERVMEITNFDTTLFTVTLFQPMTYEIAVGDSLLIATGCDKSRTSCASYKNILNFRGEPDVPGQDQYLYYPDAKQTSS